MKLDPEQRKDIIKTVLLAATFVGLGLMLLKQFIGNPGAIPH